MTESRIIVKNIGKTTKEDALRKIFQKGGDITDLKIMRRPDGSSRNFAFIGFRTPQQAQEAQKYFNNTFVGLSKLNVSIALPLGAESESSKRKGKHSKPEKEPAVENKPIATPKETKPKEVLGKKKERFLELALRKKPEEADYENDAPNDDDEDNFSASSAESSDSEVNDLGDDKVADSPEEEDNDDFVELTQLKPLSDLDYLRSKVVRNIGPSSSSTNVMDVDEDSGDEDEDDDIDGSDDEKSSSSGDNMEADDASPEHNEDDDAVELKDLANINQKDASHQEAESEEQQSSKKRLFVTNLPYTALESDLREHLETLSLPEAAVEIHIPLQPNSQLSRGIGFIRFKSEQGAEVALQALHGHSFQGRVLHVAWATTAAPPVITSSAAGVGAQEGGAQHLSAFQRQREEQRRRQQLDGESGAPHRASHIRAEAGLQAFSMMHQTAAESLLGVDRESGGEVAVRAALAETEILRQNQDFLRSHGFAVSSSSSSSAGKKSDTTFVVKNLSPQSVEAEELESLFAGFGAVQTVALSPSKTLAVVSYVMAQEARQAFKKWAYRRYKGVPLYLEWATLVPGAAATATTSSTVAASSSGNSSSSAAASSSSSAGSSAATGCSLYLKNLSFATTEESLAQHLQRLNVSPWPRSLKLFKGYGFLEWKDARSAQHAQSLLHKSVLDGYAIVAYVAKSNTRTSEQDADSGRSNAAKGLTRRLLVKNVPFQATKHEVRQLFASFAAVEAVRMPRSLHKSLRATSTNSAGQHRGFAFVDFATVQEAVAAKEALEHAHLYGRHLVIEFTKEDATEDVDAQPSAAAAEKKRQRDFILVQGGSKQKKPKKIGEGAGFDDVNGQGSAGGDEGDDGVL